MASMPSARSIGVGAFVLGGLLLFAVALFLIGNRRMLFADSFVAYAEFRSIAASRSGPSVRVAGMDAGEVKDIEVPPGPAAPFRVQMQVREDLHPLVRARLGGHHPDAGAGRRPVRPDRRRVASRRPASPTAGRSRAASRSTSPTCCSR